ncbi:DNA glycosylase/AP lyase ROS1 [Medicago truncatula]|uniref:DNA glycosylase/AP lyase ROS1 n=1 Tax=Medicago truncatula TaxID=3880 RepID=UPI00196863A3|nr:DNA glycosylase/AP lyase ROS1 [Medicago truncatula]
MIFSDPKSDKKVEEMEAQKANESSKVVNKETQNSSYLIERKSNSSSNKEETHHDTKKSKKQEEKMMILKKKRQKWEALRKIHSRSDRHIDHVDSIDWEAVRNAKVGEVAEAIKMRGQHNIIAKKIQLALNKFLEHHGTTDLEWLKYIPPNEAKEYLLNIFGLGLKSVECLRLLTLQHISFPVDVNVGRIVVRLGWVPLQPLPESIQIHNLEQFPDPIKIQQYLWPRLCKLDHHTLYELHYQLITFGKVFCTKRNPNCNACPMKDNCKYYASSLARTKLALPPKQTTEQSIVTQMDHANAYSFPYFDCWSNSTSTLFTEKSKECEPIVEMPASPELESTELIDDEKMYYDYVVENDEDIEDMMTLNLSIGNSFNELDYDNTNN